MDETWARQSDQCDAIDDLSADDFDDAADPTRWALDQAIRDGHAATVTNNVERVIEADEIVKSIHALTTELHQKICAPDAPIP